jgi:hypothetical protein
MPKTVGCALPSYGNDERENHATIQRIRSEVATLQFLGEKTKVPVPKVIGYWEGDEELPPFTIIENIDGFMLGVALLRDIPPKFLNKILKDLATIQLELLSHPSEHIGMLDISEDGTSDVPCPTLGPYSMDAMAFELDGVYTQRSKPFTSSRDYYQFKLEVWKQRLDGQQNAFDNIKDGKRLALNDSILRVSQQFAPSPLRYKSILSLSSRSPLKKCNSRQRPSYSWCY